MMNILILRNKVYSRL